MIIEKGIQYFITSLEAEQLSSHTIKAYLQDLNQFKDSISKTELDDLNFDDLQDYFMNINHLKPASLKRKRVVLHRFLKFCYRKKLCTQKHFEYVDPIRSKKNNAPKDVLSRDEITQIFSFLKQEELYYREKINSAYYEYIYYCSLRNQLIISILLYTGCRANEVVTLKKQDVNFLQNTLTLYTKGSKYNQVPIHQELKLAFEYYEKAISCLTPNIQSTLKNSIFLFPSKTDSQSHMPTRTLHDLMKKLSIHIGRHIHAHLFRHTFASYCIAANMDISTISSLISHSNPSITLSIYTHEIDAHNKQEQIKKLTFH